MEIRQALAQLTAGTPLSESDSEAVFTQLLAGQLADAQIMELLTLLQVRSPTVGELTGAARVMRGNVTKVPTSIPASKILDTCGTGGAQKTFNISTAAAIVVASTGLLHVAKHGNRSRTGRGSAEVLAQLGVNIDASPQVQARCLEEAGVCFCFAIHHHPAAKFASGPRKALGFPTIFNLLGPLTNPAGAARQLIGTYRPEFVDIMAQTLARLGSQHAMVVHGEPGLDELSTCGTTKVAHVHARHAGQVLTVTFDAAKLGFPKASVASIAPTTLEDAAAMLINVINGEKGPARDIVILSSAAAISLGDNGLSIEQAIPVAQEVIDSGKTRATLASLARLSHLE